MFQIPEIKPSMSKAQRIIPLFQEIWIFSISIRELLDHSMQYGSKQVHTMYHLVHDNLARVDFIEMLNF